MSNHYSPISLQRLSTCDVRLQRVFGEVLRHFDHSILCGHRGEHAQNRMYELDRSKVRWPLGKHNPFPSQAVDASPYPYDPTDLNRICFFAGQVVATARRMGIRIRWGGDWDRDTELKDERFRDMFHFELEDE